MSYPRLVDHGHARRLSLPEQDAFAREAVAALRSEQAWLERERHSAIRRARRWRRWRTWGWAGLPYFAAIAGVSFLVWAALVSLGGAR